MTVYLSVDDILYIQDRLITSTGGTPGERDKGILFQATTAIRIEQNGWGRFSDVFSKAAKLLHAIAAEKPFRDGNKRTALIVSTTFLKRNGQDLESPPEEILKVLRTVEEGRAAPEIIAAWMRDRCRLPEAAI